MRILQSTYRAALAIAATVPIAELAGACLIGIEDVVDATDFVALSGWASRAGDGDGSEKGRENDGELHFDSFGKVALSLLLLLCLLVLDDESNYQWGKDLLILGFSICGGVGLRKSRLLVPQYELLRKVFAHRN